MNAILLTECPMCSVTKMILLDSEKCARWKGGELVQNVWPEKTPEEREQMITGLCPKCQKKIFREEEE